MRDLSGQFDPTANYNLHLEEFPKVHPGIRMATKMAKETSCFNEFNSNALVICND